MVKEAPHLRKFRWWGAFLFRDIHADARFELNHEVAGKNGDPLADEVLQFLDAVQGFFPAVAVHLELFFLLPEPENLISDSVVVLLAVGLLDKLLLELYQPCLNAIRREDGSADYGLGDVLLQQELVDCPVLTRHLN